MPARPTLPSSLVTALATALVMVIGIIGSAPALAGTTLPATAADWIVQGDQPTGSFGSQVASAGDVNGDGYDDVLIGDPYYDGAFTDSGRILLYPGSAAGLSTTPAWSLEGSAAGALLFQSAPAGDVNGDGFDDFVVRSGQTFTLYRGSAAGPVLDASWSAAGRSAGHGDIDGDGFTDLAVFSYPDFSIYRGSAAGLETSPSTVVTLPTGLYPPFLISGPVLDDFDADGHADLAYTFRHCSGRHCLYLTGEMRVHMGTDKGLSTQVRRSIAFGRERLPIVLAAGDVDGDGFRDAVVDDYPDPASGFGAPVVYLLRGSASGLPSQPGDAAISGLTGFREIDSGRGAGDINGDGFADFLLLLDDPNTEPFGTNLLVFGGSPAGFAQTPFLIVTPEYPFGGASAGDVNGDGLGDLILNAPGYPGYGLRVGRVYVFHGRTTF